MNEIKKDNNVTKKNKTDICSKYIFMPVLKLLYEMRRARLNVRDT